MKSTETELKFLFLAIDLLLLNFAIAALYSLSPLIRDFNNIDKSLYFMNANMAAVLTYSIFTLENLYLHDNLSNRVKRIINHFPVFIIFSIITAELFMPRAYSIMFIFEYASLFYTGKILFYYSFYEYLKFRRSRGHNTNRSIIIGMNDMGILLSDVLNNNPMLGYEFVGFVSENQFNDKGMLGKLKDMSDIINKHQIDYIFVTLTKYNDLNNIQELLTICNRTGVRLRFVPENQYWYKTRLKMESVGSFVVFNPQEIPLDNLKARFAKRTFDIIFSLGVIIFILSWLFPLIFILIKFESKGPVFFFQERTGINNKVFKCLKFRSMYINLESNTKQATACDCRITKIGNFIRKTNIDELPQFFNVLFGQMSVVGPRPHMTKHTEQYSELIDNYKVRHYVKPGITGWAQVNGYRGETNELWKMEKRVEFDMNYLENWNFFWDLQIIINTLICKNAYKNAY